MIVLDKFRGGRELVPGRELVHHHYAFKTIWRRPCHLVKINRYFFQPGRPVFIIVINTSCSGVCYRIYARQNFLNNALAPNGALALFGIFAGRISCNKRPHTQYLLLHLPDRVYFRYRIRPLNYATIRYCTVPVWTHAGSRVTSQNI